MSSITPVSSSIITYPLTRKITDKSFNKWVYEDFERTNERKKAVALLLANFKLRCSTLTLQDLPLRELPRSLKKFTHLKKLHAENVDLFFFSDEILSLQQLKFLSLPKNNIANIPSSIQSLSNLVELNLSHNEIFSVPTEICFLKALEKLILNDNNIKCLPMVMLQLTKLTSLELRSNQFDDIPRWILQFKHSLTIDFMDNSISIFHLRLFTDKMKSPQYDGPHLVIPIDRELTNEEKYLDSIFLNKLPNLLNIEEQ